MREASDEHALDPVVEALEPDDGRLLPLFHADVWAGVVWKTQDRQCDVSEAARGVHRQCSTTTATSPDRRFFRGLSSESESSRSRLAGPSPSKFSTRFFLRKIIVPTPPE